MHLSILDFSYFMNNSSGQTPLIVINKILSLESPMKIHNHTLVYENIKDIAVVINTTQEKVNAFNISLK